MAVIATLTTLMGFKVVEHSRKQNHNVENESDRFGVFIHL
jgi:hypothetical protein